MPEKYFVTVKAACWKGDALLLQNEHKEGSDAVWDLPGGRMDAGDSILSALEREVSEELGVEIEIKSENPVKIWNVDVKDGPAVALLYEANLLSDDFDFRTSKQQEVFEVKWMTRNEFDGASVEFSHKQFILKYFDQYLTV